MDDLWAETPTHYGCEADCLLTAHDLQHDCLKQRRSVWADPATELWITPRHHGAVHLHGGEGGSRGYDVEHAIGELITYTV